MTGLRYRGSVTPNRTKRNSQKIEARSIRNMTRTTHALRFSRLPGSGLVQRTLSFIRSGGRARSPHITVRPPASYVPRESDGQLVPGRLGDALEGADRGDAS